MKQELTTSQANVPVATRDDWTFERLTHLAQVAAKSNLVPTSYRGHPEDCLIAMVHGRDLGLKPLQSLGAICCINGKPSLYGDSLLAIVRSSPLCVSVAETQERDPAGRIVAAVCTATRRGEAEAVTHRFGLDDAERAGLLKKQGPWQQYPARMLQMRARSWTLRDAFPDLLLGLIAAEEAADYPAEAPAKKPYVEPTVRVPNEYEKARLKEMQEAGAERMRKALGGNAQTSQPLSIDELSGPIQGAPTEQEQDDVLKFDVMHVEQMQRFGDMIHNSDTLDELAEAAVAIQDADLDAVDRDVLRVQYLARKNELDALEHERGGSRGKKAKA